jgi:methyl coenzyme M reductase subunit D
MYVKGKSIIKRTLTFSFRIKQGSFYKRQSAIKGTKIDQFKYNSKITARVGLPQEK